MSKLRVRKMQVAASLAMLTAFAIVGLTIGCSIQAEEPATVETPETAEAIDQALEMVEGPPVRITAESNIGELVPYNGEGVPAKTFDEVRYGDRPKLDGEKKWVASEDGTVYWSAMPGVVHSYHMGNRKTAQAQADKMNELRLGAFWSQDMPVEEANKIRRILTGPGLTSWNYSD